MGTCWWSTESNNEDEQGEWNLIGGKILCKRKQTGEILSHFTWAAVVGVNIILFRVLRVSLFDVCFVKLLLLLRPFLPLLLHCTHFPLVVHSCTYFRSSRQQQQWRRVEGRIIGWTFECRINGPDRPTDREDGGVVVWHCSISCLPYWLSCSWI